MTSYTFHVYKQLGSLLFEYFVCGGQHGSTQCSDPITTNVRWRHGKLFVGLSQYYEVKLAKSICSIGDLCIHGHIILN